MLRLKRSADCKATWKTNTSRIAYLAQSKDRVEGWCCNPTAKKFPEVCQSLNSLKPAQAQRLSNCFVLAAGTDKVPLDCGPQWRV